MKLKNILALILIITTMLLAVACANSKNDNDENAVYYNVEFLLEEKVIVKVKEGERLTSSDIPVAVKDGYDFLYWKDGSVIFDTSLPIMKNVTLTPCYQEKTLIALTKYNGRDISTLPDAIKDYLMAESENATAEYLYKYQQNYKEADSATPVILKWKSKLPSDDEYTVYISCDTDFSSEVYIYNVSGNYLKVYNLIPDTYFWKVVSESGAESDIDSFKICDVMRTINCGNVVNMRDEGGYEGEFGKINYGLVYRNADIADADGDAINVLVNELKIKTEIDVRLGTTTISVDDSITKVNCGFVQNDYIFPDFNPDRPFAQIYADNLKKAFLLFTDKKNYPIDFHCSAGADRTGTFAFLLGGILGVSYDDLVHDFEVTSFYQGRRWRSAIVVNAGNYCFDESGVMQDVGNLVAFDKMYRHMMEAYGTGDNKLSSAVKNYMLSVLGLDEYDIEMIRAIMIEDYEPVIPPCLEFVGESLLSVVNPLSSINLNECNFEFVLDGNTVTENIEYSVIDMKGNQIDLIDDSFTTSSYDNLYFITATIDGIDSDNTYNIISRAKRTNGDGSIIYADFGVGVGSANAIDFTIADYIDTYLFDLSYETDTPATLMYIHGNDKALGMQKTYLDVTDEWSIGFLSDGWVDFITAKTVNFDIRSRNGKSSTTLKVEWVNADGERTTIYDDVYTAWTDKTLSFTIGDGGTLVGGKLVFTSNINDMDLEVGNFIIF